MIEITILDYMKEVQINSRCKLREDGLLFSVKTGEELIGIESVKYLGKQYDLPVIVMMLFGESKPTDGVYQVLHIDGNRSNNDVNNLKWATRFEIMQRRKDAREVGKRKCDFKTANEYRNAWCKDLYKEDDEFRQKVFAKEKNWRKNNPEKVKARANRYRMTHPEIINEAHKRYLEKHPEQVEKGRENSRQYYQEHKEYYVERQRIYRIKHPDMIKIRNYNAKHKD